MPNASCELWALCFEQRKDLVVDVLRRVLFCVVGWLGVDDGLHVSH